MNNSKTGNSNDLAYAYTIISKQTVATYRLGVSGCQGGCCLLVFVFILTVQDLFGHFDDLLTRQ